MYMVFIMIEYREGEWGEGNLMQVWRLSLAVNLSFPRQPFPNPSALGKHRFPMGLFHFFGRNGGKILRGATYAVQFMCFAHVFNQYVAEATFVSASLCVDSVV